MAGSPPRRSTRSTGAQLTPPGLTVTTPSLGSRARGSTAEKVPTTLAESAEGSVSPAEEFSSPQSAVAATDVEVSINGGVERSGRASEEGDDEALVRPVSPAARPSVSSETRMEENVSSPPSVDGSSPSSSSPSASNDGGVSAPNHAETALMPVSLA